MLEREDSHITQCASSFETCTRQQVAIRVFTAATPFERVRQSFS